MQTALPVWVLNCKEAKNNEAHDDVTLRDKLGWSTWVVGFALQVDTGHLHAQRTRAVYLHARVFATVGTHMPSSRPPATTTTPIMTERRVADRARGARS
jgi:hypothetical protein